MHRPPVQPTSRGWMGRRLFTTWPDHLSGPCCRNPSRFSPALPGHPHPTTLPFHAPHPQLHGASPAVPGAQPKARPPGGTLDTLVCAVPGPCSASASRVPQRSAWPPGLHPWGSWVNSEGVCGGCEGRSPSSSAGRPREPSDYGPSSVNPQQFWDSRLCARH